MSDMATITALSEVYSKRIEGKQGQINQLDTLLSGIPNYPQIFSSKTGNGKTIANTEAEAPIR